MTNVLLAVIDSCEEYMDMFHKLYLKQHGFDTIGEYCDQLERNPDGMDGLALMLTVMLNRVHISVHHKGGQWHSHVKTRPCACSLHIASMGSNTFVALQCIPGAKKHATDAPAPAKTPMPATATMPSPKAVNIVEGPHVVASKNLTDAQPKKQDDLLKWVNCVPFAYPPSRSSTVPGCVFHSAAQIALKKAEHANKTEKKSPGAGHKPAARVNLPHAAKKPKKTATTSGVNAVKKTATTSDMNAEKRQHAKGMKT